MERKDRIFESSRQELVNIAYGMLGSLAEAEDAAQDAYLKWRGVNLEEVKNPRAYLRTIVSRLCIDRFRSARNRREEYIGPWLPEPVTASDGRSPDRQIELHDRLTVALMHLLERLSPDQRAIYLLHDVFGYTFREVAELVDKSPAACRKAAQRAREALRVPSSPGGYPRNEARETMEAFLEALQERDMDRLRELLTEDVVMVSDGGGKVTAARKPVTGLPKVSKFLVGIAQKNEGMVSIEESRVNNRPGFKAYIDGALHSIWTFSLRDGRIEKIFAVLNPEKLEGKW